MVNRNTNQLQGLFGFPFFTQPQHTLNFDVQDKDKELVIEVRFPEWKKENISVEVVQNGIFLTMMETRKEDEESAQVMPLLNEQRFFPVNFPFTEKDVAASFHEEENKLTLTVKKNDENRKFIKID